MNSNGERTRKRNLPAACIDNVPIDTDGPIQLLSHPEA